MQATLPIYYYVLSLNDLGINKACKNNNSLLSSSITVQCKGIKRRANIMVNICLSADTPAKHNKRDPHKSLRKNSISKNFSWCLEFKLNRVSNFYIIARMYAKNFVCIIEY